VGEEPGGLLRGTQRLEATRGERERQKPPGSSVLTRYRDFQAKVRYLPSRGGLIDQSIGNHRAEAKGETPHGGPTVVALLVAADDVGQGRSSLHPSR
jgi:hypothetical protein